MPLGQPTIQDALVGTVIAVVLSAPASAALGAVAAAVAASTSAAASRGSSSVARLAARGRAAFRSGGEALKARPVPEGGRERRLPGRPWRLREGDGEPEWPTPRLVGAQASTKMNFARSAQSPWTGVAPPPPPILPRSARQGRRRRRRQRGPSAQIHRICTGHGKFIFVPPFLWDRVTRDQR
ncbi:unnamed protein product [Prorocentrum cordatum]|uniref:Uncharacterized protein n=1 Tax=Prorocentrum cordatum TaxID=2364126 RepID=A0ABN9S8X2_9DINO|nr:unnamed protein product [Polarella glacialis]